MEVTVSEYAEIKHISKQRVYQLIQSGKLKCVVGEIDGKQTKFVSIADETLTDLNKTLNKSLKSEKTEPEPMQNSRLDRGLEQPLEQDLNKTLESSQEERLKLLKQIEDLTSQLKAKDEQLSEVTMRLVSITENQQVLMNQILQLQAKDKGLLTDMQKPKRHILKRLINFFDSEVYEP